MGSSLGGASVDVAKVTVRAGDQQRAGWIDTRTETKGECGTGRANTHSKLRSVGRESGKDPRSWWGLGQEEVEEGPAFTLVQG